ncbi:MAG: hypothetical protein FWD30_01530, partial [Dehalococcoidia bacterium]|nr:hypothetical protein [Dehalococcoidia bacterium]
MSIIYGRSCAGGFCSAKLSVLSAAPPDAEYYVAAYGDDVTGDGSQANPWASLAKTSVVINSSGQYKNYVVYVMTDLTSTASARYYDNNVTITSLGGNRFTVTRGSGFAALSDVMRGGYNPPMLEIETVDLTPTATPISLTLENIIFDDAYLHEGTIFGYAPTDNGVSCTGTTYVQDSIVTSYALCTTIILGDGAALHSFGGMTAARASDGATLIMQSGSLISDIGSTNTTRSLSSTTTDYRAVGETAVSISSGSHFYMYYGAKIADIANAHSVKLSGVYKCFIDGEISGMKGNKGWDATDHSTSATHEGRGFKSAVFFSGGTTLDPNTGEPGSAIIGPNANIHHNAVKCGAIGVSRSTNISIKVFGKINDNAGQTGTNWQTVFGIPVALAYGTNGGGIYVVAGGTVILEDGSEVCRNSVMNIAYGGGINIQQAGSKLIMNGGLVQDSTTADGMGPGIAVNKSGDCFFEMNGGVVDNGPNGVLLFNNRAVIATAVREDSDCNGRHILNEGNVSDVTINSLVAYGTNTANQYRNLYISENVLVQTGYVAIAGNMQSATSTTNIPRQVTLLPAGAFGDISIGNPNRALYPTIGTALPEGWTMPTSANNVIAFWMKKAGTAEFSVPAPTSGSGGANYNTNLRYFAAVMELTAAGGAVSGAPVKLYQTKIENGQIIISAPLDAYPNGAIVALVQPTTAYGEIYFEGLPVLYSSIFATDYTLPYTALYNMPSCLHADLKTDLHDNTNTDFIFTIYPDFRTIPDISSLTLTSEIFELSNAVWDSGSGTLSITLSLKTGWEDASDLESLFGFDCGMDADDFEDGEFLRLTRLLSITSTSLSKNYLICGNDAET